MNTVGIVSIAIGVFLGLSTLVYTAYSRGENKQDLEIRTNTKNTTDTRLDIKIIQTDMRYIKDDIKESRLIQQKILDKLE